MEGTSNGGNIYFPYIQNEEINSITGGYNTRVVIIESIVSSRCLLPEIRKDRRSMFEELNGEITEKYIRRCHKRLRELNAPLENWRCVEVVDGETADFNCELCDCHKVRLPNEVVHHRDGNKRNNEPNNLVVFPNQSEHARHHAELDWFIQKLKEIEGGDAE